MSHKRVLEPGEVEALLGTFSRAPTSLRNRALVVVMWRAGLRISEALDLVPDDLDPVAGTITVRHGKGDKERVVGMGPVAWEELHRWLEVRRLRGVGSGAPVFCTLQGNALAPTYVRSMLRRKAHQASLDASRCHPHSFRHAFAVGLHRAGEPLDHIRRLLGHKSLTTTTVYLERIDPSDVIASAQRVDGPATMTELDQLRAEFASLAARLEVAVAAA
jgi:site-specific recombinase XerD